MNTVRLMLIDQPHGEGMIAYLARVPVKGEIVQAGGKHWDVRDVVLVDGTDSAVVIVSPVEWPRLYTS